MVAILKWYSKGESANMHTQKGVGRSPTVDPRCCRSSWTGFLALGFREDFPTHEPDTELTQKIEDMHRTCKECVTSKRNLPGDRGLLGVLPLPHMVNALLYVDFIDRTKCHKYEYALMIVDALSAFCQVVPYKKTIDGEGVLNLI